MITSSVFNSCCFAFAWFSIHCVVKEEQSDTIYTVYKETTIEIVCKLQLIQEILTTSTEEALAKISEML